MLNVGRVGLHRGIGVVEIRVGFERVLGVGGRVNRHSLQ